MTQALALVPVAAPVVEPLTRDQIKALRAANDSIVFHHSEEHDWIGSVVATIRSTLHGQEVTARVEIPINSAITNYEEGRAADYPASDDEIAALKLRAFHMINWPGEPRGPWQTVAAQLRPGDQLALRWVRGNHNQTTRLSGLAVDEVSLLHLRNGRTVGAYQIGYSVGRKNCARMVRSAREAYTYG